MSFQKTACGITALSLLAVFSLVGCGSSAVKQRKEQRDKLTQSSKLFCEFVNGDVYANDVDVALNIEMSKRCDSDKPFSISQYKTPSENQGVLYCCSLSAKASMKKEPAASVKKEDKKAEEEDVTN